MRDRAYAEALRNSGVLSSLSIYWFDMQMNPLLDRLIGQLDTLVPFLALSRHDVFQMLNDNRVAWFAPNEEALPEAYASYRRQVNHSAFLLGYSYFESFLVDLLTAVLRNRPAMLRKNKHVDVSEIVESVDKAYLIDRVIQRELMDLFYKSMADRIEELRSRYNFTITQDEEVRLCRASLIRNCILHNSSRADARLGVHDGYTQGQEFAIGTEQVHDYGFMLRTLVRRMCGEAQKNHGVGLEQ